MDLQTQVFTAENGVSNVNYESSLSEQRQVQSVQTMMTSTIEWLNEQLPNLNLPVGSSLENLRACLLDGTILCSLLNRLSPGAVEMEAASEHKFVYVERFLSNLDRMGLPGFEVSDLEQGSMIKVLECLQELALNCNAGNETSRNQTRKRWNVPGMENGFDQLQLDNQQTMKSGQGNLDPNVNFSELMKYNSIDKTPTQMLFCIVEKVLDENFKKKSDNVPHQVANLLRRLVQEIEHRMSNQADKIEKQYNLLKLREGKYQSRIKVLQTIAVGAAEENKVAVNHLQLLKTEQKTLEEKKILDDQNILRLIREMDQLDIEVGGLKQELEMSKMSFENQYKQLGSETKATKAKVEVKMKDLEGIGADLHRNMKELKDISEHKIHELKKREVCYRRFVNSNFEVLQGLKLDLKSMKKEVFKTQDRYSLEFQDLDVKLKELVDAAESYHSVLAENRKLYNEVQNLKGNIRVYCRIRPFLPNQNGKQTTIEFIGENGELIVTNPVKYGKENRRLFKFNKVFAPISSQDEVFKDTQPLIRSVLDGYDVCIFAYGQTGSGKTYTMTGPDAASKKDWGVNYRALHDLFRISQNRRSSILYEIGVQMVEIYNEQVRDLLACSGSHKRLGIWSTTQPNGLAVPDASMHPVKSTNDVLELMNIGFMNRAVGATALNERSSRSHSILTVHVRGTDLKSNSVLRGCLHLVDLAGSERVDRSEATGDRLREAQHINKSLSALGDVVFALANKSSHVPYRNSKLTQVLQSSLGGQAKTLMFVQLNPDVESYSETISTLKFAERVSGVELGAARSNKEGRDVRELMEQVASLKETIAKKDEEIHRLRLLKPNTSEVSSPRSDSSGPTRRSHKLSSHPNRASSTQNTCSKQTNRYSETESQYSQRSNLPECVQSVNDDIDLIGFGDVDSDERLSDISDSGLSMGTETDASMCSFVEYTLFPEGAKPAYNSDKSNAPSKLPKPQHKQPASSSRFSLSTAASKSVSSSKKAPTITSSSVKLKLKGPNKRWQ